MDGSRKQEQDDYEALLEYLRHLYEEQTKINNEIETIKGQVNKMLDEEEIHGKLVGGRLI